MPAHPEATGTIFEPTGAELAAWWRFLPRWSALVAAVFVALVAFSVAGQGGEGTAAMLGAQYGRLELAIRNPGLHRVIETLEMTGWLMGNFVTVLALARVLVPHAPVRATLAAACAIAVPATGPVGRMMSRDGIGELAPLYAAATTPEQQAAVLRAYDSLALAADPHVNLGGLLVGAALTLLGGAALSHAAFPRWVAGWIAVTGLVTLVRFALHELGFPLFPPLLLLNTVVGLGGMHVALAAVFWRAAPRSTAAGAPLATTTP